jgi:dipeptidyl-peptidase 4
MISISRCCRNSKPVIAALLVLGLALPATTAELTIERLFAAPDLSGDSLRSAQLSPDGQLVTYLKGAADNRDRLDLWAYDVKSRAHRLLVDARLLMPDAAPLSAEEAARRERQRTSALSGILEYSMAPDSRHILVPLGGDLYLYDLNEPPTRAVRRLTHTDSYETDARVSPRGRYVSFIRDQNLVVIDLATGAETPITRDGAGTVSYGMAEFIAQEEMDRDTGYWWSPDDSRIAYTRADDSGIPETERFEINARTVSVVKQRYPFTGKANARVDLFVATLALPQQRIAIDPGAAADSYLARVDFFPDGRQLALQRQSRDQKTLTLLRADESGKTTPLVTEHSETWVPLHQELTFLKSRSEFVWASSRDGFQQLYLYGNDGTLLRQLTRGEGGASIRGIDEKHSMLFYVSAGNNPRERQLYRLKLDRPTASTQITAKNGWHEVTMSDSAQVFLDTYSTTDLPPSLTLYSSSGKSPQVLVANTLQQGHPYFAYSADHAHTEFGTFNASDGQVLHYSLIRPPHAQPGARYPVVVNVYGGPRVQNVTNAWGGNWQMFDQLLARAGFVVFRVDSRGSGTRGVRFESALYHQLGSVEVTDQIAGAQFLRTLPFVDGKRIGIMGWSYGGYMALLSILKGPDSFAAAAAGAPVTDWRLYDTHYTERYMGTPQQNPEGYTAADVMTYAATLKRPLLLIHGMADDNVLFTHSTALIKTLQDANKPFELMTYPGGKHGLIRHQDAGPHVMGEIYRFFERELKPARPSSPSESR